MKADEERKRYIEQRDARHGMAEQAEEPQRDGQPEVLQPDEQEEPERASIPQPVTPRASSAAAPASANAGEAPEDPGEPRGVARGTDEDDEGRRRVRARVDGPGRSRSRDRAADDDDKERPSKHWRIAPLTEDTIEKTARHIIVALNRIGAIKPGQEKCTVEMAKNMMRDIHSEHIKKLKN